MGNVKNHAFQMWKESAKKLIQFTGLTAAATKARFITTAGTIL